MARPVNELTLTSFNSVELNLTEFIAVNNLATTVTVEHNRNPQFSKAQLTTLNINDFKMIESMGLKIIASRSP
jgi:hypothetical protein